MRNITIHQPGRTAYLDCFSGISGDMFLGALLHAGLDEEMLRTELAKLKLEDATIEVCDSSNQSIGCKKVTISQKRRQALRTLPNLIAILDSSDLNPEVKQTSAAVFKALAEAEAKVHGISVEKVHFHEIGALDTIFDVVGVVIGLHLLNISRVICSPLPLGRGFVQCDHGRLPLPAPAVCELIQNIPSYGVDIDQELVTPTGAALAITLADEFGTFPAMTVMATGYGAGSHELPNKQPNLLRLCIGTEHDVKEAQEVTVIETRLDDWNPEGFPFLCDLLLKNGALDVSLTPCQGKKGRPGFHLQVIAPAVAQQGQQELLLSQTTAIGLRYRKEQRRTLPRESVTVPTKWGDVKAKSVVTPRGTVIYPEYESCKETALINNISLDEVYRAIYAFSEEQ
ncbi:nickel pincer cofactor biosynthesis protein LarC [Desulfosediminicola flagellatus]|uniref:nickel pincer cofactor biosynthesis protein LarC n=1 Tax=Desulfosediminicola flagellatus TaxID=2569541 RepID=UPI001E33F04C|nr:nickel pincer cofactor biosynthesis protein LarC [Desulfosediminicola flagellatus]